MTDTNSQAILFHSLSNILTTCLEEVRKNMQNLTKDIRSFGRNSNPEPS